MRLKKHQSITLITFIILAVSILGILASATGVNLMASAKNSPYRVSLHNFMATPTPFQPNAFANILEDGTVELIPQPVFTPTAVPFIPSGELASDQLNILLLGVDDFGENNFRTDVIVLLSIDPQHKTVSMVSFPRDLYVTIPGYWSNRINTAWSLGGFSLLQDTLAVNFGIRPDYYMMVNFDGFIEVINSIGGINVEVTEQLEDSCGEYQADWCTMTVGEHHLDGYQALWYARSRKTTSDFDRNRRAQQVIEAGFRKAMNLSMLAKAPELYRYYREYVDTNLPFSKALPFLPMAPSLMNSDNIRNFAITPEMAGNWITAEGAMVLIPDNWAIQQMLAEALYSNE